MFNIFNKKPIFNKYKITVEPIYQQESLKCIKMNGLYFWNKTYWSIISFSVDIEELKLKAESHANPPKEVVIWEAEIEVKNY